MSNNTTINNYFSQASNIITHIDGLSNKYSQGSGKYTSIINSLNQICSDCHEMPAFGVSIHNETIEAIKSNVWLELIYEKTQVYNDMPFDRLLISINSDHTGFNIIRYHNNKYDGRCYYIDLNTDMSELFNVITA